MPESWVNQYFDGAAPNPDADADEDGLTNFQELKWGLNPTEADALTADFGLGDESVTFMATAGIPYVLERSENLVEWSPWNFVTPESTGTAELSLSGAPEARSFFRLLPVE
jgi:hypothetical protein